MGKELMTSGAIMFGSMTRKDQNARASRFYEEKTDFYRTLDELLAAVKKKLSLD